eukprot:comp21320_c0_seq1/m.29191 comp21320_c0_seq1/g.29191  ORF comp21320_c0_seq1/g.29191 comp21320_c0_seq1/m.29191 type:complete len:189 (-) comp21320_c0_seq1:361-927(-)
MKAFLSSLFVAALAGLAIADQACYYDDAACSVNGTCTAATPNTGICAPAPMGSFATLNKTGTTYTLNVFAASNCTGEPIVTAEAEENECVTVEVDVVGPVNLRFTAANGTTNGTTTSGSQTATGSSTATGSATATGSGSPATTTSIRHSGTSAVPSTTEAAQTTSGASKTTVSVVALCAAALAFFFRV